MKQGRNGNRCPSCCISIEMFFSWKGSHWEGTEMVQHYIQMTGRPIRQLPCGFSIGLFDNGEMQIKEMVERDVTEHSTNPWTSLVVLVKRTLACT